MMPGTVVLVGNLPLERSSIDLLAGEFGWSLKEASGIRTLARLNLDHTLIAVLFSPQSLNLPWEEALEGVLDAAPGALPIVCHGFADRREWPRMAEAGAFHSLLLPFSLPEVRTSLGFVWAAKSRTVRSVDDLWRSRQPLTGKLARTAAMVA